MGIQLDKVHAVFKVKKLWILGYIDGKASFWQHHGYFVTVGLGNYIYFFRKMWRAVIEIND